MDLQPSHIQAGVEEEDLRVCEEIKPDWLLPDRKTWGDLCGGNQRKLWGVLACYQVSQLEAYLMQTCGDCRSRGKQWSSAPLSSFWRLAVSGPWRLWPEERLSHGSGPVPWIPETASKWTYFSDFIWRWRQTCRQIRGEKKACKRMLTLDSKRWSWHWHLSLSYGCCEKGKFSVEHRTVQVDVPGSEFWIAVYFLKEVLVYLFSEILKAAFFTEQSSISHFSQRSAGKVIKILGGAIPNYTVL